MTIDLFAATAPLNLCHFSPCRQYRYSLVHKMREGGRRIAWIGLNPSTADEQQLDPTLRRIRQFSLDFGFDEFVMLNLFAFRTKSPKIMMSCPSPFGPQNAQAIAGHCHPDKVGMVVAAWSIYGRFQNVDQMVRKMLAGRLHCLKTNEDGSPSHPLYLPKTCRPMQYN